MIKWVWAAICVLLPSLALAVDEGYLINPGDVLGVSVWKEEGLERQALVLPDGTISFPLAGEEVRAAGRTTVELQAELAQRIRKFIPDAVVNVSVINASGNKIYLVGEVTRPGEYQVVRPTNVLQAISLAGGLTPFASYERIRVLRQTPDGSQVFSFSFSDVRAGEALESNIVLQSGDVIVVPGSSLF